MRTYHYIEIWEEGNDRMPVQRSKTLMQNINKDLSFYQACYPNHKVIYSASSEQEKVFNHIKQTA